MSYNIQPMGPSSLQTAEERQMGLFLHLSGLAFAFVFPLGIVLPIILWQTQKEKRPNFPRQQQSKKCFFLCQRITGFKLIKKVAKPSQAQKIKFTWLALKM